MTKIILYHYIIPIIICGLVAIGASRLNDWINQIHNDHNLLMQVISAIQQSQQKKVQ